MQGNVLILVLMEYGLRVRYVQRPHHTPSVLILVLMEYGLRVPLLAAPMLPFLGVLILVLMEYGLRDGGNLLAISQTLWS